MISFYLREYWRWRDDLNAFSTHIEAKFHMECIFKYLVNTVMLAKGYVNTLEKLNINNKTITIMKNTLQSLLKNHTFSKEEIDLSLHQFGKTPNEYFV